jgi:hemoglobin
MALYEAMGGAAACRNLAEAFYARVARDPVLRPFFPGKTFTCAIEAFTAFLIQFLGGPAEDTQRRHFLSLHESHARFPLGPRERDAWMSLMKDSLEDAAIPEPARTTLLAFFGRSAAYLIRSDEPGPPLDAEIEALWQTQLALDEAVEAVRSGDAARAIALADPSWGASRFAAVLAAMIATGHRELLAYVRQALSTDPTLVHARFDGRTLLHATAATGNVELVEHLLQLGADPDSRDGGGHTPLYSAGNACRQGGAAVVRVLVRAGAGVDTDVGVKRCTPLHMAARRGNVGIAAALLDCGARIEARDSAGETPLRRAVNCGKVEVARLLLERGADPDSPGSRGLTPRSAARSGAMQELFSRGAKAHRESQPWRRGVVETEE